MQLLIESHGFKLTLTQAGDCNDEVLKIQIDDSVVEIIFQSLRCRLAGNSTFPEDR